MNIPIEISARHIHLSKQDAQQLFGQGYELNRLKTLSQTTEFAAKETVLVQGDKGVFPKVRIIGPYRKNTQLEISKTDARFLGIQPVLKLSGDIENTPGIIIKGTKGEINISQGVIVAKRHLHASEQEAQALGIKHNDIIGVKVKGVREIIFSNVIVRVHPTFSLALHLDADEANAAGIDKENNKGELIRL